MNAYLLLTEPPADLAELWGEDAPQPIDPGATRAQLRFDDDVEVTVELVDHLNDDNLGKDGAISLLHQKVMPVVSGHVAALALQVDGEGSGSSQVRALCEAIVSLPSLPEAVVWFPYRHQVTTQVMFVGELMQAPVRAFYWVHAAWLDAEHTSSVASARGLSALGLPDLQITGTAMPPTELFVTLGDFVGEALANNQQPGEGVRVLIGGVEFTGVPDTDIFTDEPVLGLVPTGAEHGGVSEAPAQVPPYDPSQSGEAFYLLLDHVPGSLGDVMVDFMPKLSAVLREDGAIETQLPYEEDKAQLDITLVGRIDDPALLDHASRVSDPATARQRVNDHAAAVRFIATGECSIYDLVMYQVAWAQELSHRPEAIGVWIPYQERFEPQGETLAEGEGKLAHLEVHSGTSEGTDVLYTRGMRRFGGLELIIHDLKEGTSMRELLLLLADDGIRAKRLPRAGQTTRTLVRKLKATFHEMADVVTGEPALSVELQKRKFLGLF